MVKDLSLSGSTPIFGETTCQLLVTTIANADLAHTNPPVTYANHNPVDIICTTTYNHKLNILLIWSIPHKVDISLKMTDLYFDRLLGVKSYGCY